MERATAKRVIKRLKIIEGQVRGLTRMVEEDEYCINIITQTLAVKKALSGVEDVILEDHLYGCLTERIKKGKGKKAVNEVLQIYKVAKNK